MLLQAFRSSFPFSNQDGRMVVASFVSELASLMLLDHAWLLGHEFVDYVGKAYYVA